MNAAIQNQYELKAEILLLENMVQLQSEELKKRFGSPKAIMGLLFSTAGSQNYLQLASRILLPLALNNTLFMNTGFLVRALAGLVPQNVVKHITEDSVKGLWHKITSMIGRHGKEQPE